MARSIAVTSFGGSTPRRADHLVEKGSAVRAIDCKLWHGTLQSWRTPRTLRQTAAGTKSTYQAFNCCWLESTACTSWAEGSAELRHVFATQYNDYAYPVRIVLDSLCEQTVYRLGLPCPPLVDKPIAMAAESYSKAAAPRQYAYQYVDSFGGFSALSEPSEELTVADGTSVLVSGWSIPAGGWDIKQIRIFRTVVGFESVFKDEDNKIDAAWMLVGTVAASSVSYVDAKWDYELSEAQTEDFVEPPPEDLRGICWVKSMNCLVGFSGRYVYFSENNNYHNWIYKLLLDDTVKAIVESNDVVYIATDGAPYVIEGQVDPKSAAYRKAQRLAEGLPLIGSTYQNLIAIPSGAIYVTHHGLVYLSKTTTPSIVSAAFYAPDDWQELHPDTARIGYHNGRIFAFFRNGAFCMSLRQGAGTGTELDAHTELSLRPSEVFTTRTGRFMLRFGIDVKEWDTGDMLMSHTYESSETLVGVPFNFGAAQVRMNPGTERFEVYCDDYQTLDEQLYQSDSFPMPMWATGQEFKWILTGTAEVKAVWLAPSLKEF